jgi:hypothetical protein
MLKHERRDRGSSQFNTALLRTAKIRFPIDGLTSLRFRLVGSLQGTPKELYTHFLLEVGLPTFSLDKKNGESNVTAQLIHRRPQASHKNS